MANPFLVLGGIAVGIITASFGVLQVPGWVKSAQDASAVNDLSNAAIGEGVAASRLGEYLNGAELAAQADELGMSFQLSNGVKVCVTVNPERTDYASVALSPSGSFFARVTGTSEAVEAATADDAIAAVGGLPAGVPSPVIGSDCATPEAAIPAISNAGPGGGNPGGGNPGGGTTPDGDGGLSTAAPLGVETNLGDPFTVAYTTYGVFAYDRDRWDGIPIVRVVDGQAHEVNFTGPIADSPSVAGQNGLVSDLEGNLYVSGVDPNGGDYQWGIYRIAPDGTSTVIRGVPMGGSGPFILSSPDGAIYYANNGEIRDVVSNDIAGTYGDLSIVYAAADNAGNFYIKDSDSQMHRVPAGGSAEPFAAPNMHRFVVGPNGDLYGSNVDDLVRVAPDGSVTDRVTPYETMRPGLPFQPWVMAVDRDGNLYGAASGNGSFIFMVTPSGELRTVVDAD